LKNTDSARVSVRCPAELPRDVQARIKSISKALVRTLGMRDVARIDFRLSEDGRIYFLEVNALPSLEPGASLFAATKREGLSYEQTIGQVVKSAAVRWGLQSPEAPARKKPQDKLRVGFTYNMKRVDSKAGNDAEAEYDPPETIDAIRGAIESLGHEVVPLEANSELPQRLAEAKVDLVFNIAEGLSGRNREAQVPALCELVGIPYTGSDSATLALALDKALAKRILRQHGILTPEFQVMATGREKLHAWVSQKFPLIVKPNAEGSSKGITGSGVVDDETGLRAAVKEIVDRYRQPALVEEYVFGREFTVGLLGDKKPRILPPMEICFKDLSKQRPVYDFEIKQEWEKHVYYECPAKLSPSELKAVERAARETFIALDCRDVARIDLRMNAQGQVYVLEVNPLPGLTPDYSDLVLISKAAGIEYRTLISEILAGGLKRLREKKRGEREEREAHDDKPAAVKPQLEVLPEAK
jgi:D-alanine-D-alanine ligase